MKALVTPHPSPPPRLQASAHACARDRDALPDLIPCTQPEAWTRPRRRGDPEQGRHDPRPPSSAGAGAGTREGDRVRPRRTPTLTCAEFISAAAPTAGPSGRQVTWRGPLVRGSFPASECNGLTRPRGPGRSLWRLGRRPRNQSGLRRRTGAGAAATSRSSPAQLPSRAHAGRRGPRGPGPTSNRPRDSGNTQEVPPPAAGNAPPVPPLAQRWAMPTIAPPSAHAPLLLHGNPGR